MKRSIFMLGLLLIMSVLTTGVSTTLAQQPYPNRPIQFIIPNVPGSILDITGRALADELGRILGTQIISTNKPGAGTVVGIDAMAKSKKDGYTLAYTSNAGLVYARVLNPETVPFDPDRDLEPLGRHLYFPNAISVQTSSPWKTFNELLDYAKKNPGKIRVGTMGIGSPSHFSLEVVQSLTGAQFTHVPFKGGEFVVTALLGGHVETTFDSIVKIIPHVESGKARVLLLTGKMPIFPNFPTMIDLGYKQDLFSTWFGMHGPAGMPEEVKKVLIPAIEKAVKNPELKAKIEKMYFVVNYKSPTELKKMIAEEYERGLEIAHKAGLRKTN